MGAAWKPRGTLHFLGDWIMNSITLQGDAKFIQIKVRHGRLEPLYFFGGAWILNSITLQGDAKYKQIRARHGRLGALLILVGSGS